MVRCAIPLAPFDPQEPNGWVAETGLLNDRIQDSFRCFVYKRLFLAETDTGFLLPICHIWC